MKSAIAVALLAASLAYGQPAETVVREPDKVIVRQKTVVDFSQVEIAGELTKPEGSYAIVKRKAAFDTLVKVRDNFAREMRKSVEQL